MSHSAPIQFFAARGARAAGAAPAPAPPLLWDAIETARQLHISPRTLWSLTRAGKVPHLHIGRQIRYSPAALERWIDAQTVASSRGPQSGAATGQTQADASGRDSVDAGKTAR